MSDLNLNLNEKVVLVTGASRGIGQAIIRRLAELGATVIGTATTEDGVRKIEQTLADASLKGQGEVLRLDDSDSVAGLLERLGEQAQMPSVLVNNAGIARDALLLRMKDEDWDAVLDANLKGVFQLTRGCVRPMLSDRQGRIISLTSVVAFTGNAGQANYAAAKAGLVGFSRALAQEVGGRGITVNCVAPGFIETDMTQAIPEQNRKQLLAQIPLGRLGASDEVAAAVAYLACDSGAYITGQTLHVNGGMYMG